MLVVSCSIGVFLIGLGGVRTAMSYDLEEFLNRCMADICELAILMSSLRHYSTTLLGDDTYISATRAPGEGVVIGRPVASMRHRADA